MPDRKSMSYLGKFIISGIPYSIAEIGSTLSGNPYALFGRSSNAVRDYIGSIALISYLQFMLHDIGLSEKVADSAIPVAAAIVQAGLELGPYAGIQTPYSRGGPSITDIGYYALASLTIIAPELAPKLLNMIKNRIVPPLKNYVTSHPEQAHPSAP